jgi:hypothetical protein
MAELADQLHRENAPVHSTALVQALISQSIASPTSVSYLQPRFDSLRLLAFHKAKIAVEKEVMCEYDGHTIHKLSQGRLTAD